MVVFRIAKYQFANDLSGMGAALYGGRWNPPGTTMLYTAMNRSLAMAEVLVHLSPAILPVDFRMVSIDVPASVSIEILDQSLLPPSWNLFPPPLETQEIGGRFIRNGLHCGLQVPSVVTAGDFNILLNPAHPDFPLIKIMDIEPFIFDQRFFKL